MVPTKTTLYEDMKDSKILYIKYLVWFMGIYFVFVFRVFFEIRGKEIVWDQNYCFLPWNSMFVIQRLNVFSNKCLSTMQSVNGFSSKRLSVYCLIAVHWSLGKSLGLLKKYLVIGSHNKKWYAIINFSQNNWKIVTKTVLTSTASCTYIRNDIIRFSKT